MTWNGWLQIAVFFLAILACAKPLGIYMAAVMEGRRTWLSPILSPCERLIYRICGISPDQEQRWTKYAASLLAFSAYTWLLHHAPVSTVATYAYVNPVIAVFLGWALLHEDVTAAIVAGAVVIVASVALVVRQESLARPRPAGLAGGRAGATATRRRSP